MNEKGSMPLPRLRRRLIGSLVFPVLFILTACGSVEFEDGKVTTRAQRENTELRDCVREWSNYMTLLRIQCDGLPAGSAQATQCSQTWSAAAFLGFTAFCETT